MTTSRSWPSQLSLNQSGGQTGRANTSLADELFLVLLMRHFVVNSGLICLFCLSACVSVRLPAHLSPPAPTDRYRTCRSTTVVRVDLYMLLIFTHHS